MHAAAFPDDPFFGSQWALSNTGQTIQGTAGTVDADIDAPEAWATTTGSPQVVIAVVDTGMDASAPDLAPNLWTNSGEVAGNGVDDDHDGFVDDVHGWDFVEGDATANDDDGHGTHVAGIADARGNDGTGVAGVSWQARLLGVRALDANGNGSLSDVIAAFEYAADRGARIVNASLGGAGTSQTFLDALNRHPGTLLVAAAGNAAPSNNASPQNPLQRARAQRGVRGGHRQSRPDGRLLQLRRPDRRPGGAGVLDPVHLPGRVPVDVGDLDGDAHGHRGGGAPADGGAHRDRGQCARGWWGTATL